MRAPLLLVALSFVSFAGVARADIPPSPGYVETCTAATQQQAGEVCVECETFHGEPTRCRDTLGTTGHTQRCRTSGASVWTEVWCRARTEADGPAPAPTPASTTPSEPAATPAATTPASTTAQPATAQPTTSSSCAIAAGSPASALPALVLALALLARRRRAR